MFVRKDSLGELSDTRRGLLAQEDMLRFRLKFSVTNKYNFDRIVVAHSKLATATVS